jgi:hypothetical protein
MSSRSVSGGRNVNQLGVRWIHYWEWMGDMQFQQWALI